MALPPLSEPETDYLPNRFASVASRFSQHVALISSAEAGDDFHSLTFAEAAQFVDRCSVSLKGLAAVVFVLPRSSFLALAALGASSAGVPWAFAETGITPAFLASILSALCKLSAGGPSVAVVYTSTVPSAVHVPFMPSPIVSLTAADLVAGHSVVGAPAVVLCATDAGFLSPHRIMHPLYLMPTSGSSNGLPRWVVGPTSATAARLGHSAIEALASSSSSIPGLCTYGDCTCDPPVNVARHEEASQLPNTLVLRHSLARALPWCGHVDVGIWKCPLSFVDTVAEMWGGLMHGYPTVVFPEPGAAAATRYLDALVAWATEAGTGRTSARPMPAPPAVVESNAVRTPLHGLADVAGLSLCIAMCGVTRLTAVPALLQSLVATDALRCQRNASSDGSALRYRGSQLGGLRVVTSSGGVLTWGTAARVWRHLAQARQALLQQVAGSAGAAPFLLNVYGSAEVTADVTVANLTPWLRALGVGQLEESLAVSATPVGPPFPNCATVVLVRNEAGTSTVICIQRCLAAKRDLCNGGDVAAVSSTGGGVAWREVPVSPEGVIAVLGAHVAMGYASTNGAVEATAPTVLSTPSFLREETGFYELPVALCRVCDDEIEGVAFRRAFVSGDLGFYVAMCCKEPAGDSNPICAILRSHLSPDVDSSGCRWATVPLSCPCGCGGPVMLKVTGRRQDALHVVERAGDIQVCSTGATDIKVAGGGRVSSAAVEAAALALRPLSVTLAGSDARLRTHTAMLSFAKAMFVRSSVVSLRDCENDGWHLHLCVGLTFADECAVQSPPKDKLVETGDSACETNNYNRLPTSLSDFKSRAACFRDDLLRALTAAAIPSSHVPSSLACIHVFALNAPTSPFLPNYPAIPTTNSGKVDERALMRYIASKCPTQFGAIADSSSCSVEHLPVSPQVCSPVTVKSSLTNAVWQCFVGALPSSAIAGCEISDICGTLHFWDAGGDSLAAVQLVASLSQVANEYYMSGSACAAVLITAVNFDDLLRCPTVSEMANYIITMAPVGTHMAALLTGACSEIPVESKFCSVTSIPVAAIDDSIGTVDRPVCEFSGARVIETWGACGHHAVTDLPPILAIPASPESVSSVANSGAHTVNLQPLFYSALGKCIDAPPLLVHIRRPDAIITQSSSSRASQPSATAVLAIVGSHACEVAAVDCSCAFEYTGPLITEPPVPHLRAPLWRCPLPDRVEGAAVVHLHSGTVAVGCYDGAVYGITIDDGELVWRYPEPCAPTVEVTAAALHPHFPWLLADEYQSHTEVVAVSDSVVRGIPAQLDPQSASVRGLDVPAPLGAHLSSSSTSSSRKPSTPIKCAALVDSGGGCGARECSCERSDVRAVVWFAGYDRLLTAITVDLEPRQEALPRGRLPLRFSTTAVARVELPGSVVASPIQLCLRSSGGLLSARRRFIVVACTSGDVCIVDRDAALLEFGSSNRASSVAMYARLHLPAPVFATPLVTWCGDGCDEDHGNTASFGVSATRCVPADAVLTLVTPCADGTIYGLAVASSAGQPYLHTRWRVLTGAPCFGAATRLPPLTCKTMAVQAPLAAAAQCAANESISLSGSKRPRDCGTGSDPRVEPDALSVTHSPCCCRFVVGSHDGLLRCVRAADGSVLWASRVANQPLSHTEASGGTPLPVPVFSAATWTHILAYGTSLLCVCAAAIDGTLGIFAADSGARIAQCIVPGQVFSSPVTATAGPSSNTAVIVMGCRDDNLWVLQLSPRI